MSAVEAIDRAVAAAGGPAAVLGGMVGEVA